MMEPTSRFSCDYPIYSLQPLARNTFAIAGGGGRMKSGIPNKIQVLVLSPEKQTLTLTASISLPDAPVALATNEHTLHTLITTGMKSYCYKPPKLLAPASSFTHDVRVSSTTDQAAIALSDQHLVIASDEGHLTVLKLPYLQQIRSTKPHTQGITDLAIHPDLSLIASTSRDRTALITHMTTGKIIQTLKPTRDPAMRTHIRAVRFTEATDLLFTAESNPRKGGWIAAWRTQTTASDFYPFASIQATVDAITAFTVNRAATLAAVSSAEGHVTMIRWNGMSFFKLWSTEPGTTFWRAPTPPHVLPVTGMSFAADGDCLLTASADYTVATWPTNVSLKQGRFYRFTFCIISLLVPLVALWVLSGWKGRDATSPFSDPTSADVGQVSAPDIESGAEFIGEFSADMCVSPGINTGLDSEEHCAPRDVSENTPLYEFGIDRGPGERQDGEESVGDGRESVLDGEESIPDVEESVVHGEASGSDLEDSIADGKISVVDGDESAAEWKEFVADGEEFAAGRDDSFGDGDDSVGDGDENGAGREKTVADGKDSVDDGKDSVADGKESVAGRKESVGHGAKSVADGEEDAEDRGESVAAWEEAGTDGREDAVDWEESIADEEISTVDWVEFVSGGEESANDENVETARSRAEQNMPGDAEDNSIMLTHGYANAAGSESESEAASMGGTSEYESLESWCVNEPRDAEENSVDAMRWFSDAGDIAVCKEGSRNDVGAATGGLKLELRRDSSGDAESVGGVFSGAENLGYEEYSSARQGGSTSWAEGNEQKDVARDTEGGTDVPLVDGKTSSAPEFGNGANAELWTEKIRGEARTGAEDVTGPFISDAETENSAGKSGAYLGRNRAHGEVSADEGAGDWQDWVALLDNGSKMSDKRSICVAGNGGAETGGGGDDAQLVSGAGGLQAGAVGGGVEVDRGGGGEFGPSSEVGVVVDGGHVLEGRRGVGRGLPRWVGNRAMVVLGRGVDKCEAEVGGGFSDRDGAGGGIGEAPAGFG